MYCDIGFHTDLTLGKSAIQFKHLKKLKFENPIAICDQGNLSQLVKSLGLNKMNIPAVELSVVSTYKELRYPADPARFFAFDLTGYQSICYMIQIAQQNKRYGAARIELQDIKLDGDIAVIVGEDFQFIEDLPFNKMFIATNKDSDLSSKLYFRYNPIFYYDSYAIHEKGIPVIALLSTNTFRRDSPYHYYDLTHYNYAKLMSESIQNYKGLLERHQKPVIDFEDRYPIFSEDAGELFEALVEAGFDRKCGHHPEDKFMEYRQRLDFEKSIIRKMHYENYFLVNWDFINWARCNDIPIGPGRGSAAGSLVAYCLDITKLDPLANGLYFERFLNPERISPPDIDTDIDSNDRHLVAEYIKNKYGRDKVANIITFSELKAKSALKDAARIHNVPADQINLITAAFPPSVFGVPPTLDEAFEVDVVKKWSRDNPHVWQQAKEMEGFTRQTGIHAAGLIIAPKPLHELTGVSTVDGDPVCQLSMGDAEKFGLLKMDLLGLETLCLIKTALKQVGKSYYDMEQIPLDDPAVFERFAQGDTHGIFQFESPDMRKLLTRIKPNKFADIAATTALYRPGPLTGGLTEQYIKNKNSDTPEYFLPEFEELLAETYGVFVYQEQVMLVAQKIAGFTLSRADSLRKAIGKKDHNLMQVLSEEFVEGSVKNGYEKEKAESLWKLIQGFADYCFNKSHSYAYSMLSYWAMYLKHYHPSAFAIARMTSDIKSSTDLRNDFHAFKDQIEILDPCVNTSQENFSIDKSGAIRIGLGAIHGLGSIAKQIMDGQPYNSVGDFLDRNKLDKSQLESLILVGAFSCFEKDKEILLGNLERMMLHIKAGSKTSHIMKLIDEQNSFHIDPYIKMRVPANTFIEQNCYGFNYRYGFMNENAWMIEYLNNESVIGQIVDIKRTKTKKDQRDMAIITLETLDKGQMKVLVFDKIYKQYSESMVNDAVFGFSGKMKYEDQNGNIGTGTMFANVALSQNEIMPYKIELIMDNASKLNSARKIFVNAKQGITKIDFFERDFDGARNFLIEGKREIYYDEELHKTILMHGFVPVIHL